MKLIKVAILTLIIRVCHLCIFVLFDSSFADYDSSVLLSYNRTTSSPLESLMVWDSVFYTQISNGGYEYEQFYAFFPLFPLLSSLLGPRFIALSAITICILSSVIMTTCFAWLSVQVLNDSALAASSTILLLFSQASTFHIAAYTESLFGALTMAGLCCLHSANRPLFALLGACLLFTLASASRSNGVIYAGYLAHYCLERSIISLSWRRDGSRILRACLWILIGAATSLLVFSPMILFQFHGYRSFCLPTPLKPSEALPNWCEDKPIPRIYPHVQSRYWGVGFLKYWQLKNLPNFILAAPSLLLTATGCYCYARRSRSHLQLVALGGLQSLSPTNGISRGFYSPAVAVHLLPWAFMASCAATLMHVQVATRFLSCCPASYWFTAHLIAEARRVKGRGGGQVGAAIWAINLGYTMIGSLLFVNFYPWT